jgi:hypothetical protein
VPTPSLSVPGLGGLAAARWVDSGTIDGLLLGALR